MKYKLFTNFLSKDENKELMDWSLNVKEWQESKVLSEDVKNWRKSNVYQPKIDDKHHILMDKILPLFPDLHNKYYGEYKKISNIETQLTKSHDGDFYKAHPDNGDSGVFLNRKLTYVYYMHTLPKQFINGNLRIYEEIENPVQGRMYKTNKYIDIEPLNNTLIIFPSYLWHEVLPVRCALDWTYSRFTINGWLH